MKFVPPIALFSGGMLITAALLVAMALGFNAYFRSSLLLPQPLPATFTASMAQATSVEGLRQACAGVAQIYDSQVQLIRGQSAHITQLFGLLSWGIIGIGLIVGPVFLYIYFATRKWPASHS